jgi:hypothetical protein
MTFSSDNNINNDKDDDKSYEGISVVLRLKKNIVQILRIFANTYGEDGSTEEKRIDNFLSEEVTKIVETLASDSSGPVQKPFPDSLKKHVKNLLNKATNNNNNKDRKEEDLK